MKTAKRIPSGIIMLGLVSLFTDAASEMIYPLVPVYVAALGSGPLILGVIEGVAETTASFIKLLSGMISDRTGKRKIFVLTGYLISSVIRPLTGIVTAAWQIVIIRMADRVGKGIRTAPRDALIASYAGAEIRGKSYGFHRAMDHTGAVIGPLLAILTLGILIIFFGIEKPLPALRWTFLLAIIPGIIAVLTVIFLVKEKNSSAERSKTVKISLKDFDRNFRTYLIIMVLFTLGNSSDAFLLFRVEESIRQSGVIVEFVNRHEVFSQVLSRFGTPENQADLINILFLPLVWSFFHIIKALLSTPLGALSDRTGRKKVINTGWAVYAFVYFSFALLIFIPARYQAAATFVLFGIYALYYAFSEGAEKAFVADLVKDEQRGTAFGLFNFAVGLGALPASIIFGFIYASFERIIPGYGGTVAFGTGGCIALISMLLLSTKVREQGFSANTRSLTEAN